MRWLLALLLALPLLATQGCMQPEEGDVDTLYVYRKDTVYHRDTLIAKAAVETLSIDLFTYLYKYKYAYGLKDTMFYLTPQAKARLQDLDHILVPSDSAYMDPLIIYPATPKAFYVQTRIDTFETWDIITCSSFVSDTLQAVPDSVKWMENKSKLDTTGGFAYYHGHGDWKWRFDLDSRDSLVVLGFWRYESWSVNKVEYGRPGEIHVPDIHHIAGKGFRVDGADTKNSYGLHGRLIIVIQK